MKTNGLTLLITASIGAFLGCALFMAVLTLTGFTLPQDKGASSFVSVTPGMDRLDDYTCPKGQKKIQIVLGKEDGFSREGDESAIMRPLLMEFPLYVDYYNEASHVSGFRNFDEGGVDAKLITYVDFPAKIEDGIFVARIKFLSGSATDGLYFADIASYAYSKYRANQFSYAVREILEEHEIGEEITLTLALSDFKGGLGVLEENLRTFLKSQREGATLDLMIQDDTIVDFVGLALCQAPLERKGTTLRSDSRNLYPPDIIFLACQEDPHQHMCDPHAGDLSCAAEVPLGCYRDGDKPPPPDLAQITKNYAGGDIRLTQPVAAQRFKSFDEASAFCAANFGKQWRTLSFHEGGGSVIFAHGNIPPKSRMWVDVKDKPAANCWTNWPDWELQDE